jgi:hypothetical protein
MFTYAIVLKFTGYQWQTDSSKQSTQCLPMPQVQNHLFTNAKTISVGK